MEVVGLPMSENACIAVAPNAPANATAPCLHPDKVRPSLEAFGFDIGRTLSELFGIRLLWGKDGILPEYLMLVSGLFHNSVAYWQR